MLISDPPALAEVAAKLRRDGLPAVEDDLARAGGPVGDALRRALARAAHLLASAESERELGDALALRLTGIPQLAPMVERFRATRPGPCLDSRWPMPDQPAPALARVLDGRPGDAHPHTWSPDGRWLVSVSRGIEPAQRNAVRLWDARTWRSGPTFDHGAGRSNRVDDCFLPPSGEWLATCAADAVWIWDMDSGDLRAMFEGRLVAAAPDGSCLLIDESPTPADQRRLKRYQMPDGRPAGDVDARPGGRFHSPFLGRPGTVTWAATGPAAAWSVTTDDGWFRIREAPGGRVRHEFEVGGDRIGRFVSAPDGSWLAAEIGPRRTRVWDTATGEVRATIECELGPVHTVAPDGSRIAATLGDAHTVLLDVTGGRSTPVPVGGHSSPVTSYAISPDGARLAAGCQDGTIWLWDLDAGVAEQAQRPDPRRVSSSSCAAAPNASWLATVEDDRQGRIAIWDVTTGQRRRAFGSGGHGPCAAAPDGTWLATARSDAVLIWEVATGRLRHRVECPVRPGEELRSASKNHVADLAVAPDGTWFAAACEDGTVRLLDAATGQTRNVLDHPAITGRMLRCAVAPDGRRLVCSGLDGTVVHDLSSGTSRKADSAARLLDISPDGSLFAAEQGLDIRVWTAATGETQYVLRGHTDFVKTCRWSPDGSRLASVGDSTVRIWAAADGEIETTVRLYTNPTDCCWLRNGRTLAVTSRQGLHLFDLRPVPGGFNSRRAGR